MRTNRTLSLVVFGLLVACTSSDDETQTPTPEPQKENFNHLFDCKSEGFEVSRPLAGPGFDPEQGGLTGELQQSYLVHTTQIFVRPEKVDRFYELAGPVLAQLAETPGLIGYSLAGDKKCGDERTFGVWANEEAMYKFVTTGAHAEAIPHALDVGYTGRVVHWTATAAEINALDWPGVDAKLHALDPEPLYD
jgi:quinol monooxygenase YgiN